MIVAVVTDGQENASREFRKDQIEKMITARTELNGWQFVFLSADLAAIGDAAAMGIRPAAVLLFEKDALGNKRAWASLSKQTAAFRENRKRAVDFDEADRQHPDDPAKKRQ